MTVSKWPDYLKDVTQSIGVSVEDAGVPVLTPAVKLNFTGAGVTVTDDGIGGANIDVPGGGVGGVSSIVAGSGIAVDNTDPANPVVSATSSGIVLPESVPAVPNAADEEFLTPTLAPAWSVSVAPGPGFTGYPSYRGSWLALRRAATGFSGSDTYEVRKPLALGAGAFAITLRGSNCATGNYGATYATFHAGVGATDDLVKVSLAGYNTGYFVGRGDKRVGNIWNYGLGSQSLNLETHGHTEWIHVQRDGASNWHVFWSRNGVSFYRISNWFQALNITHISLGMEFASWGPAEGAIVGGIDFMRRDWVDLL